MASLSPSELQALVDEMAADPDDVHIPASVRYNFNIDIIISIYDLINSILVAPNNYYSMQQPKTLGRGVYSPLYFRNIFNMPLLKSI